jgi:hypothetical protein
VAAGQPAAHVGERVRDEDGDEHGDEDLPAVGIEVPQEHEVAEPETDPGGAEHRRGHRDGRGLAGLGDGREDEREQDRDHEAADHPLGPSERGAEDGRERAAVAGEHERPQRARHLVELVEREQRGQGDECEERPAAVVGREEDKGQPRRCDGDPT